MAIKITTLRQVAKLLTGDVLLRYPLNGDPGNKSDGQYQKPVEVYEIRYINPGNEMMELVTPAGSRILFASPGDVGRLFIKSGHLVAEKVWWLQ